jgi:hypothetical protein
MHWSFSRAQPFKQPSRSSLGPTLQFAVAATASSAPSINALRSQPRSMFVIVLGHIKAPRGLQLRRLESGSIEGKEATLAYSGDTAVYD